ncbi:MAG: hypothetical protein M1818_001321 [Claussenomyces sp. TS43310]|nr:MAG: hypothetical protein M1818_001321 [Claussenomyces sp. TS43310]
MNHGPHAACLTHSRTNRGSSVPQVLDRRVIPRNLADLAASQAAPGALCSDRDGGMSAQLAGTVGLDAAVVRDDGSGRETGGSEMRATVKVEPTQKQKQRAKRKRKRKKAATRLQVVGRTWPRGVRRLTAPKGFAYALRRNQ